MVVPGCWEEKKSVLVWDALLSRLFPFSIG